MSITRLLSDGKYVIGNVGNMSKFWKIVEEFNHGPVIRDDTRDTNFVRKTVRVKFDLLANSQFNGHEAPMEINHAGFSIDRENWREIAVVRDCENDSDGRIFLGIVTSWQNIRHAVAVTWHIGRVDVNPIFVPMKIHVERNAGSLFLSFSSAMKIRGTSEQWLYQA